VPKIFYSSIIPSSIDRVWSTIRDFNEFPSWHPEFCDCSIEGSRPSDAVGCVRSLYLKSGGHFRERLLTLSDREYMFTYTILESPLPITDYVSTVQLRPVTDTDQTYAQWTSEFNCAPDVEPELMKTVLSVYQGGFDSLRGKFNR
jgi:Polyketide cyclase / dehydrase and lipid transport